MMRLILQYFCWPENKQMFFPNNKELEIFWTTNIPFFKTHFILYIFLLISDSTEKANSSYCSKYVFIVIPSSCWFFMWLNTKREQNSNQKMQNVLYTFSELPAN